MKFTYLFSIFLLASFATRSSFASDTAYISDDDDEIYSFVEEDVESYKNLSLSVLGSIRFNGTISESAYEAIKADLLLFYSKALKLEAMLSLSPSAELSGLAQEFFQSLNSYQIKIHNLFNSETLNINKPGLTDFRVNISNNLKFTVDILTDMLRNWDQSEI
ncbi:MAG: hypothetical protein AB8G05_01335 [Oligoflexales bacterium]